MNRFAIDEDDQFEIHVKEYSDKCSRDYNERFLLYSLDNQERQKLEQKDEDFMQTYLYHCRGDADVPDSLL